ncbi:MAG: universal stress protein [Candidatus Rokuibacteriota bacterium]
MLEDMWAADRKEALRRLGALVRAARGAGVQTSPLLAEGPPAAASVRAASRKRADLLVLGTHGRTGVRRMLLGSVAERVVRTASCPVLTVRPRR